jgi:hypothetical protein
VLVLVLHQMAVISLRVGVVATINHASIHFCFPFESSDDISHVARVECLQCFVDFSYRLESVFIPELPMVISTAIETAWNSYHRKQSRYEFKVIKGYTRQIGQYIIVRLLHKFLHSTVPVQDTLGHQYPLN